MLKKLLRSDFFQWLIVLLVAAYVMVVRVTCKWQIHGAIHPNKFWQNGQPVVVAMFHGQLLLSPFIYPKSVVANALISHSRDGQIISKWAKLFGLKTTRGSTSKGGIAAARELVRAAKRGETIFITPDGPKGPYHSISRGTVDIPRLAKAPLIPASISIDKCWQAGSWDKFIIPKPFATITVKFGPAVPADIEKVTIAMEKIQ